MKTVASSLRGTGHERALLVGIALVLLMGTLPVFAHHLPLPGLGDLGQLERIGAICVVALHLALAPVHGVIHVLLAAGLAYAVFDRVRAGVRLRRGMQQLDVSPASPGSRIFVAAREAGLGPSDVFVAREAGNPAFTFGGARPKVCISAALEASLSDDELRCVLAHEACHVCRRDPLRLSVLRFLGLMLFWIPALRRMAADVAIEAELEADQAGAGDTPLIMASALIKAAKERTTVRLAHVTPLIRDDLLGVRVRRLAGESASLPSRITRRALAGAMAALALVWISGAVMAHPLHGPDAAGSACLDHSGWAASHLFCTHYVAGGKPCPHSVVAASTTQHGNH